MKNKFTQILVTCMLLLSTAAVAQDVHLSQFYASPLLLNPAMTGNISGGYRASLIYRNQWSSIPAPYSTVAASFDASLLGCKLGIDHLGAGLALYNDRSGDGVLNEFTILASLAYHKGIDQEGRFNISAGAQVGYTQKSIDFTKLNFENQISNYEFVSTAPNGEPVNSNRFSNVDFRAGGLFTGIVNDRVNLYAGGGFFHLTKPQETFLVSGTGTNKNNQLDSRLVMHGGGTFGITNRFSILPSVLYMTQTANREITVGTAFGYSLTEQKRSRYNRYGKRSRPSTTNEGSSVYLGAWYRVGDAVIPYLGLDFSGFRFGFSYDINISDLKVASLNQGGVELSLVYTGKTDECPRKQPLYCPRF